MSNNAGIPLSELDQSKLKPLQDQDGGVPLSSLDAAKFKVLNEADQSDSLQGLKGGALQTGSAAARAVEGLATAFNKPALKSVAAKAADSLSKKAQQYPLRVGRVEDIGSIGDAIDFAQGQIAQNAPNMALTILGAKSGEKLGRKIAPNVAKAGSVGAAVGGGTASLAQNFGSAYSEQREQGVDDPGKALAYSVPMAALDTVLPAKIAGRLTGRVAKAGINESGKRTIGQFVKEVGKDVLTEAGTEGAQEAIGVAHRSSFDPNYDPLGAEAGSRILNAFVSGGVAGAPFSAASHALHGSLSPDAVSQQPEEATPTAIEPPSGPIGRALQAGGVQTTPQSATETAFDYKPIVASMDEAQRQEFMPAWNLATRTDPTIPPATREIASKQVARILLNQGILPETMPENVRPYGEAMIGIARKAVQQSATPALPNPYTQPIVVDKSGNAARAAEMKVLRDTADRNEEAKRLLRADDAKKFGYVNPFSAWNHPGYTADDSGIDPFHLNGTKVERKGNVASVTGAPEDLEDLRAKLESNGIKSIPRKDGSLTIAPKNIEAVNAILADKPVPVTTKAPSKPDPSFHSALQYIAMHGGIDPSDPLSNDMRASLGIDPGKNQRVVGIKNLFARAGSGMSVDDAAQLLWQSGYMPEHDATGMVNKFYDGDFNSIYNDPIIEPTEEQLNSRYADEAAGQIADSFNQETVVSGTEHGEPLLEESDLEAAGFYLLSPEDQQKVAQIIRAASDQGWLDAVTVEYETEQGGPNDHPNAKAYQFGLYKHIKGRFEHSGTEKPYIEKADPRTGSRILDGGGEDASEVQPELIQTNDLLDDIEDESSNLLSQYTEQELSNRDSTRHAEAEALRQREDAPSPDNFVMTGSNRMADELAARGQRGLFDTLPRTSNEAAEPVSSGAQKDKSERAAPEKGVTAIDQAVSNAHIAAPTEAQKEAGNYRKAHVKSNGFDITIESGKGADRTGTGADGKPWSVKMPAHYGYIKRTTGADGDHVDVFVGVNEQSDKIWAVNQNHPDGRFDEHKLLMGFSNEAQARKAYMDSFADGFGKKVFGSIVGPFSPEEIKAMLPSMEKAKPIESPKKIDNGTKTTRANQETEAKSGHDKQNNIDLDWLVKTAADSVEKLRAADVGRVLEQAKTKDELNQIADAIIKRRPEFKGVTLRDRDAIAEDNGWDKPVEQQPEQAEARPIPTTDANVNPASRIEDVGDALTWNRKGMFKKGGLTWDQIANENDTLKLKMATKEKVWARPDWENMVAAVPEGVERNGFAVLAHMVKQVYDAFPKQPQVETDQGIKDYISALSDARELAERILNNKEEQSDIWQKIEATRAAIGRGKMPRPFYDGLFPMVSQGTRWRDAPRESELARAIGNKALTALQWSSTEASRAMNAVKDGWPTKKEAWQVQGFSVAQATQELLDEHSRIRDGNRSSFLATVGINYRPIKFEYFDNVRDARAFVENTKKELAGKWLLFDGRKRMIGAFSTQEAAIVEAKKKAAPRRKEIAENHTDLNDYQSTERKGLPDRREAGRNITADELKDAFGFRGVNFGKWVPQNERQGHLNNAYDAFHDLAEVMGLPANAMSLNGMLGIAFGAQGTGGKGGVAAHFVPGVNEINLTRMEGAGALAHEWGHALDHWFGVQGGMARNKAPYASHMIGRLPSGASIRPEMAAQFKAILHAMRETEETKEEALARLQNNVHKARDKFAKHVERYSIRQKVDGNEEAKRLLSLLAEGDAGEYESIPPAKGKRKSPGALSSNLIALLKAVGEDPAEHLSYYSWGRPLTDVSTAKDLLKSHVIQRTIHTNYYKASQELDGDSNKSYWATDHEMFARAFESWVMDKLAARDGRNDYLVRPNKNDRGITNPEYPYPAGAERKLFNQAFDALTGEIKTRTDDTTGGTVMYSKRANLPETIDVDGVQRHTTNSNGKPIHPTVEGVRNFWRWFGDSKVVDSEGRPLVVYHGTPDARFASDDGIFKNRHQQAGMSGGSSAFWFAKDRRTGATYADDRRAFDYQSAEPGIVAAYLSLQNPLIVDGGGKLWRDGQQLGKTRNVIEQARDGGHDGVVIRDVRDDYMNSTAANGSATRTTDTYVVFDSRQIKSATGNTGAFDPADPSILHSRSGQGLFGTSVEDITAGIRPLLARWKAVPVEIVKTVNDLPANMRDAAYSSGATDIEGMHINGRVYLVAGNLPSVDRAREVLAHEIVGHAGMEKMLGPDLMRQLTTHIRMMEATKNKLVLELADAVDNSQPGLDNVNRAKEIVAMMAERGEHTKSSVWQKVLSAIRDYLRRLGFKNEWLDTLTVPDVLRMLRKADEFVQAGAREPVFHRPESTLPAFSKADAAEYAADGLKLLGQLSDAYRYKNPILWKSLDEIAAAVDPGIKIEDNSVHGGGIEVDGEIAPKQNGGRWSIVVPDGSQGELLDDGKNVWVSVPGLKQGTSGGSSVYVIAGEYAHRNKRTFIGDPMGLSDPAKLRRTEHMLSLAIRHGTTKHIFPHKYQSNPMADRRSTISSMLRPLNWDARDDEGNLLELIRTSYANTVAFVPEVKDITYNFEAKRFEDKEGKEVSNAVFERIAQDAAERIAESHPVLARRGSEKTGEPDYRSPFGSQTLKRAVVISALSRGTSPAAWRGVLVAISGQLATGRLDAALQNILYSRPSKPQQLTDSLRNALPDHPLIQGMGERIADSFKSDRTLNRWWHGTVGTQYHKAKVSPEFGRVFNSVQSFLTDTSRIALQAESQAPDVLAKLNTLSDLPRAIKDLVSNRGDSLPAAESAKLGKALFGAQFESDGDGGFGKRWTEQELRDKFGFDDRMVMLHNQYLNAIGASLDSLARSEMVRQLKLNAKDNPAAAALAEYLAGQDMSADRAADVVMRGLGDDSPLAKSMDEIAVRIQRLKESGYVPLMRFGEYTVDVKEKNGDRLYFGMFETQRQANEMAKAMREEYPDANVVTGVMSKEDYKLFNGVSPETMALFAEASGLDKDKAYQEYLKNVVNSRSAMKRLIHRKLVPGFSDDVTRSLAQFLVSNARLSSSNIHLGDAQRAAQEIPKEMGDVKDEAGRLVDYVSNPREEASRLRGLLFAHFLGGSLASGMVNMTQPFMMTLPYLSQFGGAASAGKHLASALKDAAVFAGGGKPKVPAEMKEDFDLAISEGILAPHEIHQLMAEAQGSGFKSKAVQQFMRVWGHFFATSEAFNRYVTFTAAWNVAKESGHEDAFGFAKQAVIETQGLYNKGNRPNWARGAVGATVFTFKQFSISYMEFLKRLPRKQQMMALGLLVLASGLQGLPFQDDLDDLIDALGNLLGYPTNSKKWKREVVSKMLGETAGSLALSGISTSLPIDLQGRLSMGNLLPGTGLLNPTRDDQSRQALEMVGPAGAVASGLVDAVTKGEPSAALPSAIKNGLKGIQAYRTGSMMDSKGRKIANVDTVGAVGKMIGFQPSSVAQGYRRQNEVRADTAIQKNREQEIANLWAEGVAEGDKRKVQDAREQLVEWNRNYPRYRIQITGPQILNRVRAKRLDAKQRLIKATPKEMRAETAAELAA